MGFSRRSRFVSAALGFTTLVFATADTGCGSTDDGPPLRGAGYPAPDAGDGFEAGGAAGGPPATDAGGYCGNEVHEVIIDAPNLYFVLDASGSMAQDAPGTGNRYDAVRIAVVNLVRNLGPLANVGAAVLPKNAGVADECATGSEVFPVTPGDPFTGEDGPTTTGLRLSTITKPLGGTPVSPTLVALTPKLLGLSGKTYVVIATDGGPNCNDSAVCDVGGCMLNIEGTCGPGVNCCAPGQIGGPRFCVDDAATIAAIEKLHAGGINVVTVGIPGSEIYGAVLDGMAVAGGLPRPESPRYHRVDQLEEIGPVLAEIAKIAVTCEFALVNPPPEEGNTNVYLDGKVLLYNEPNGWIWKPPWIVRLLGDACDRVQTGKVAKVQIVSGCPTEIPK